MCIIKNAITRDTINFSNCDKLFDNSLVLLKKCSNHRPKYDMFLYY